MHWGVIERTVENEDEPEETMPLAVLIVDHEEMGVFQPFSRRCRVLHMWMVARKVSVGMDQNFGIVRRCGRA